MALLLIKPTQYGVPASYWRVILINTDYCSRNMTVTLAGYASQKDRDAGRMPIVHKDVLFRDGPDDIGFREDATRADIYVAVKALPDWTEAKDG